MSAQIIPFPQRAASNSQTLFRSWLSTPVPADWRTKPVEDWNANDRLDEAEDNVAKFRGLVASEPTNRFAPVMLAWWERELLSRRAS